MFHYYNSVTNSKGDALSGYYVGLEDSDGAEVDIYADDNATPIIATSGLANRAKVDSDGNVSLFVDAGTYDLVIYATDSTSLVKRVQTIPMQSGEPGDSASITIGTVSTLSAGSSATVTNVGTSSAAVLDFGIPKGDTGSGSGVDWGAITGTLADQTDLDTALDALQPLDSTLTALAASAWTAGTEVLTFTGADTVTLKTVGSAAGNILDKTAGDALYATDADLEDKADATLGAVVSTGSNVTLATATHNNKVLKLTGTSSQGVTLNSTPDDGHSTIIFNNASGAKTISAASGAYVNGASSTATSASLANGGVCTAIHIGSGVWLLSGSGLT